jgi:hypothetical protein
MFKSTSWTEVPDGLDNSSSLVEYVNKGILVKNTQDVEALKNKALQASKVTAPSAPVAPKVVPVAPKVVPVVVEAPKPTTTTPPVAVSPTNK